MNDRIQYISESEVKVQRYETHTHKPLLVIEVGGCHRGCHRYLWINNSMFDLPGLDALAEIIACYKRDGNFKALAPPKPEPKYRAYTPLEAVHHLDRAMNYGNREGYKLIHVGANVALISGDLDYESYENLVKHFTWSDTGEPCGVLVEDGDEDDRGPAIQLGRET